MLPTPGGSGSSDRGEEYEQRYCSLLLLRHFFPYFCFPRIPWSESIFQFSRSTSTRLLRLSRSHRPRPSNISPPMRRLFRRLRTRLPSWTCSRCVRCFDRDCVLTLGGINESACTNFVTLMLETEIRAAAAAVCGRGAARGGGEGKEYLSHIHSPYDRYRNSHAVNFTDLSLSPSSICYSCILVPSHSYSRGGEQNHLIQSKGVPLHRRTRAR